MICVDYYQVNGGVTVTRESLVRHFESWDMFAKETGPVRKAGSQQDGSKQNSSC
jgi:hypothetical protein